MSLARPDRPAARLSGISPLDAPRRLAPGRVAFPSGTRGSSLSDLLFYSSKSGVKDGAVSPIFPPLRCTALQKNRFPRLQVAFRDP